MQKSLRKGFIFNATGLSFPLWQFCLWWTLRCLTNTIFSSNLIGTGYFVKKKNTGYLSCKHCGLISIAMKRNGAKLFLLRSQLLSREGARRSNLKSLSYLVLSTAHCGRWSWSVKGSLSRRPYKLASQNWFWVSFCFFFLPVSRWPCWHLTKGSCDLVISRMVSKRLQATLFHRQGTSSFFFILNLSFAHLNVLHAKSLIGR